MVLGACFLVFGVLLIVFLARHAKIIRRGLGDRHVGRRLAMLFAIDRPFRPFLAWTAVSATPSSATAASARAILARFALGANLRSAFLIDQSIVAPAPFVVTSGSLERLLFFVPFRTGRPLALRFRGTPLRVNAGSRFGLPISSIGFAALALAPIASRTAALAPSPSFLGGIFGFDLCQPGCGSSRGFLRGGGRFVLARACLLGQ